MNGDSKASILIVDDRPESLLAIEVALEGLGEQIIKANSGEEALRHLLRQDFAVVLLDVNMPGLGGFETAELIRGRKTNNRIPIIFITAFADDILAARGYSLGAVDYMLAPVVPEVLRTKVGVFVELYRKNEQLSRQARLLGQRADRFHRLTGASLAIHSAVSIDRLLEVVTDLAREIVGCRFASTQLIVAPDGSRFRICDCAEGGSSPSIRCGPGDEATPLAQLVLRGNRAIRMARAELAGEQFRAPRPRQPREPQENWLGIPLRGRDGLNMGLIELADRTDGDFTDEDEAVVLQLSQMTSIAIENTRFAEERDANRLKDEFLATLSHELRTPLNAIVGWTQILRLKAGNQSELAEGLAVIERNVRAQNRLVDDLLDMSRIERGELRLEGVATDVMQVLSGCLEAARPGAAAKGIELSATLEPRPCVVVGDPDRLAQIFGNVLSNAIKFTPDGGRIDVLATRHGNALEVAVADTGEGIESRFLPFIFERFRQGEFGPTRRYRGLGLGLTIVRHLIELHGGSVRASSAGAGHGTTITLTLPVLADAGLAAPVGGPRAGAAEGPLLLAGARILAVDDEEDALRVLAETLRQWGAEVLLARSVAAAIGAVGSAAPHLVISDIAMPGASGLELIRRLRELPEPVGSVPAIALSALATAADRTAALRAGFQLHVAKPFDPAQLAAQIVQLLRGRIPALPAGGDRMPELTSQDA